MSFKGLEAGVVEVSPRRCDSKLDDDVELCSLVVLSLTADLPDEDETSDLGAVGVGQPVNEKKDKNINPYSDTVRRLIILVPFLSHSVFWRRFASTHIHVALYHLLPEPVKSKQSAKNSSCQTTRKYL